MLDIYHAVAKSAVSLSEHVVPNTNDGVKSQQVLAMQRYPSHKSRIDSPATNGAQSAELESIEDIESSSHPTVVTSPITELIWLNHAHLPAGNVNTRHLHPFFQLDVVFSGEVEYKMGDAQALFLKRADAVLVPPMTWHESYSEKGYQHASFKIRLSPMLANRFEHGPILFRPAHHIIEVLEDACRRHIEKDEMSREQVIAVGTLLLIEAVRNVSTVTAASGETRDLEFRSSLFSVLQLLEETSNYNWTVASLAKDAHLSVDYFSKRFREAFGLTPQEYLMRARMRWAAQQMLADPAIPIKKLSIDLGYSSAQTFSRAFKHAIGKSPAQYRASRP